MQDGVGGEVGHIPDKTINYFPDSVSIDLYLYYSNKLVGGPGEVRTLDLMTASNPPVFRAFHSSSYIP